MSHEIWLEQIRTGAPSHDLIDYLVAREGFRSPASCQRYFEHSFGEIRLFERAVLEIGSSNGWLSLYAATQGASRVTVLASAQSSEFEIRQLGQTAQRLGAKKVEVRTEEIEEFESKSPFDVAMLRSSICNLDPRANHDLEHDPAARDRYRHLLSRLNQAMSLGGKLVISDVSRHNWLGSLGILNPRARNVEWSRHHDPSIWIPILYDAGFGDPELQWQVPVPISSWGRLTRNRAVAFFHASRFRLVVTKRVEVEEPRWEVVTSG